MSTDVRQGVPQPGWSDRINDPEILAGVERNRKTALTWCCIAIIIALVAPFLVSIFVENTITQMEALKIGGVIAGAIAIFSLFSRLSHSIKNSYEGEVIDKREELEHRSNKNGDSYKTRYVTYVKRSDGSRTKIKDFTKLATSAWEYLRVGDRFKYHPQLGFPYELYDKSKAPHLFCPVCAKKNPVEADRCSRCHAPLLK